MWPPRGLTPSAIPYGERAFAVEFDSIDPTLWVRASDVATRGLALVARSVADFYVEYMAVLRSLGFEVTLMPSPVEVVTAIPFAEDRELASYEPDATTRCWQILRPPTHGHFGYQPIRYQPQF
jgi:hypothetical protein